MKTAIELIKAERERQVSAEGWTLQHDDGHTRAELSRAALCYVDAAASQAVVGGKGETYGPADEWPWETEAFKAADDPIRNLVKAGALIVAEIERLQRLDPDKFQASPASEWRDGPRDLTKKMREITSHKVNLANDKLEITVRDEPGSGGACHCYKICGYDASRNPSLDEFDDQHGTATFIMFQNGPINVAGVNGITQEALLAICIDRLESFQAGPYACRENALALTKLQEAQMWLQKRTRDRLARGVEGTHEK